MATSGGTVRRVKQEARLRRTSHHHHHHHHQQATPAIAYLPDPAVMTPNPAEVVDGYGAYKPVPPPKPLSSAACYSPPPYRMPPYPLYGETAIPGAAAAVPEAAVSSTAALHTHSSKFPIEREVILSSADKNSKIPILNEYKKQRPKSASAAAIAPEGPNKQVAWTEDKKIPLTITTAHPMQVHDAGRGGPKPQLAMGLEYRSQYRGANGTSENQYMYNGHHSAVSTGAVPRTWMGDGSRTPQHMQHQSVVGRSPAPLPHQEPPRRQPEGAKMLEQKVDAIEGEDIQNGEASSKEGVDKNKAFPTRTYHTIKDMISSRFGSGKVPKEGVGGSEGYSVEGVNKDNVVAALNNTPDGSSSPRKMEHPGAYTPDYGYQRHQLPPAGGGIYMVMRQNQQQQQLGTYSFQHPEGSRPLTEGAVSNYGTPKPQSRRGSQSRLDEDDDEGGFVMRGAAGPGNLRGSNHSAGGNTAGGGYNQQQQSSGQSSDYEKATQRSTGQSSSNADSGRGSTVYSGGHQAPQAGKRGEASERLDTSTESSDSPQALGGRREGIYGLPATLASANDSEWVDIVESELRQILDPKLHGLGHPVPPVGANSTLSESISSLTPPLPPLSPGGGSSPSISPQNSTRYKHGSRKASQGGTGGGAISKSRGNSGGNMNTPGSRGGWNTRSGSKNQLGPDKQHRQSSKKSEQLLLSSMKGGKMPLSASVFGLDTTDLTSTTTGLDSMLDGNTENNSSDDDLSTTIDTTDAQAIRKQLEGLENMYSEVLKLLGVKKYGGRYQPSDPRINKRRLYGSMSSLPSSVSSRPIRDKRRQDERKKVKDMKGINKRFQRLESHVVTLARSVAHLSSEMRTQHLMIQEMENIRGEISALRSQTLAARSQSMPRGLNNVMASGDRDSGLPALTNPARVKKLTKFFGDEPPLLRLFLKKLGYEKYAGTFEQERVGMVELPYLTEERLQKMGVPLGPRLRILQEAQISVCRDKIYVV